MARKKKKPKPETKTCPHCGKEFSRMRKGKLISLAQWKVRKYCSNECNRAVNRPDWGPLS